MFKTVLLILILLACTAVGKSLSSFRRKRSELLGELLSAMRVLRLRMLNSSEPLGILMHKSDSGLFRELGKNLCADYNLQECWAEKKESAQDHLLANLRADDLKILDTFFQNLGSSGRDEQNQLFAQTIPALEENYLQARQKYRDSSRLFTALGSLIGIAICILIV